MTSSSHRFTDASASQTQGTHPSASPSTTSTSSTSQNSSVTSETRANFYKSMYGSKENFRIAEKYKTIFDKLIERLTIKTNTHDHVFLQPGLNFNPKRKNGERIGGLSSLALYTSRDSAYAAGTMFRFALQSEFPCLKNMCNLGADKPAYSDDAFYFYIEITATHEEYLNLITFLDTYQALLKPKIIETKPTPPSTSSAPNTLFQPMPPAQTQGTHPAASPSATGTSSTNPNSQPNNTASSSSASSEAPRRFHRQ